MTHLYNLRIGAALAVLVIAVSVLIGWPGLSLPALANGDDWGMVEVTEFTKTEARVTITFVDDPAPGLVHWRFRIAMSKGQWLGPDRVSVIGGISEFPMTNLSPGIEYELQVSLDGAFSKTDILSENFTTLPPDPSVSEVIVEDVTLTEGTVVITIANPGTSSKTVHIRYCTDDSQPWSDPPITTTTVTGTARKTLLSLNPGTQYEVEASLGNGFLATETASTTFITLLPRVSSVSFEDVTTSEATVKVTIAEPGPGENKVYLRYGIASSAPISWIMPSPKSVVGDSTAFSLIGLAANSDYEVQVSLDSAFTAEVETATFTTAALPSIGSVNMADVEQTSASAIVSIFDSDETTVTVHLRFREMPLGVWSAIQTETTATDTAEFTLSGLTPDTQYEVEASLDRSFSNPLSTTFTTHDARPRVSGIATEDIARTTASVTLNIANPESRTTAYLHYRAQGAGAWIGPESGTTSSATVGFTLMGLTPDTIYELEASLDDNFPAGETLYATFITEPPANVSGVSVGNRTHTGVTVTVSTDVRQDQTSVYLRFRPYGQTAWVGPETRTASSGAASFTLTVLMPDTEYEIEASTDRSFPAARTVYETFSTSPAPRISLVSVGSITNTKATVTANISRPQPRMTVYLRYRTQGAATWNSPEVRITSSSPLRLTLVDLMPATQYEVEASLNSGFSDSMSKSFTTAEKGPTVSGLGGGPMTPTMAKVIVNLTDAQGGMAVYLRYRVWGSGTWNSPETRTTSTTAASFELTQLTPDTTYQIEASLDRGFPAVDTVSAIFTTEPAPMVSVVSIESVTQTEAIVTVSISHPEEISRIVYVRYRELPEGDWSASQTETDALSVETVLSGLTPGMGYEVQASFYESFPATDTQEQRFNTLPAETMELPTPVPATTPTPTPEPTFTPEPAPTPTPTPTPKAEPTVTPSPTPSPTATPPPALTPIPAAPPSHTPTPTNTPRPIETPAPTSTAILTAVPLLSPTPAPTSTPQAEEENTGTDLALVITVVTLTLVLTLVIGFFVYRRRMES